MDALAIRLMRRPVSDEPWREPLGDAATTEKDAIMPDDKGHKAEEDVDAETHQTQSRAAEGEEDGSYVGAAGSDDSFDAGESGAEARSQDG
ncbi:hypothetical protein A5652_16600 [Mycobacterium sp. 1165178.9]|nr:hypothetical protein A5652_16600 [Mycobacterium sp. 1165178.9]